ncbi:MAG: hypothetical protein KA765_01610 [Thermoflexales bacterium]|nr:hypothetical protein [Thermoflexales bacterium]
MNPKLKLSLIAVIGVASIVLVLMLVQSPSQNVPPASNTPPQPGTSNGTSVPSSPETEPTMTAEEQQAVEEVKRNNPQSASSPDQCPTILQTQPWCSLIGSAKRITRPEWEELFPQTQFFLVPYTLIAQESRQLRHVLVIEQDGQRFSAESFDQLLNTNNITITDSNRELVIKAFVLTTLADYLEQDVTFSNWTQGDWPGSLGRRFTYSLTVWTKIQGLRMKWFFAFENNRLWLARRLLEIDYHIGDYIDVPFEVLPLPGSTEHLFRGQ